MSTGTSKNDAGKESSPFTYANVVATLALLLGVGNLILHYPKLLHPFGPTVGVVYRAEELLPQEACDELTVVNTGEAPLENVVVAVKSPTGSEIKFPLGKLEQGANRRLALIWNRDLVYNFLPRVPYEMDLGDSVVVTSDGYLPREFAVKDLGKTQLLHPKSTMPEFAQIQLNTAVKFNGQEIYCLVHADGVQTEGDHLVVTDTGASRATFSFGRDVRTAVLPSGVTVTQDDLLFVQGTLHLIRRPPDPANVFGGEDNEYTIVAKDVKILQSR